MFPKILLSLLVSIYAIQSNANENTTPPQKEKIYILNKSTKCRYRKKDHTTYCVDKDNKNITGVVRKYQEGYIVHSFNVKDSLVEGKMIKYYLSGNKKSETPYVNGQIDGLAYTYYEEGEVKSVTPYQKGKKEGNLKEYYENGYIHTQTIYKDNISTGATRVYAKTGETLFDIKTTKDNIVESGNCYFLDKNNKLSYIELPSILINAFNNNCAQPSTTIKNEICSIEEPDDIYDCNEEWLNKNQNELSKYMKIESIQQ